jgi:hypothetical protein
VDPTATSERYSREEKSQPVSGIEHCEAHSLVTVPAAVSVGKEEIVWHLHNYSEVKFVANSSLYEI